MALLSGAFTYRKFRIAEELPKNFKETLVQRLPKYHFREIDPKKNPESSIGWINAFTPTDTNMTLEKVLFGKYIILGIRKDRKSIAGAMLKAQLSDAIKTQLRERKGRKLSREELNSLKEMVKEKLLSEISPTTALFEAVWNYETQEVYFSSQATKASTEFAELFEETFELPLTEENLVTRTEAFIEGRGLDLLLVDIEPANLAGR